MKSQEVTIAARKLVFLCPHEIWAGHNTHKVKGDFVALMKLRRARCRQVNQEIRIQTETLPYRKRGNAHGRQKARTGELPGVPARPFNAGVLQASGWGVLWERGGLEGILYVMWRELSKPSGDA